MCCDCDGCSDFPVLHTLKLPYIVFKPEPVIVFGYETIENGQYWSCVKHYYVLARDTITNTMKCDKIPAQILHNSTLR